MNALTPCRMTNALSSSLISCSAYTPGYRGGLGISRRTVINRIQRGIEGTRRLLTKRGVVVAEAALRRCWEAVS